MDETIVICMDGTMYVELAMYVWMKLMCWISHMFAVKYIYIYIYHIFAVKMLGYKKKQNKKRQCRLFAVCHRRQRVLCRLPQTAKCPRGSNLCNLGALGADPFGHFAVCGRRQRGGSGKDGKEARQRSGEGDGLMTS